MAMGDGRWAMGDGRWAMGDGRKLSDSELWKNFPQSNSSSGTLLFHWPIAASQWPVPIDIRAKGISLKNEEGAQEFISINEHSR